MLYLCFKHCPLIFNIEQFDSINWDSTIFTRCELFGKDQKAIMRLIHADWFDLFNSMSVFDYSCQFKRREFDVYFHYVLCNRLVSPHHVLVPLFVVKISKKDERLVRDWIKCSWMTFGYWLKFSFLTKITFPSPRVDFCFVMKKYN